MKLYIVTKSPHEEDYEDDNPPPWEYYEDGFVSWVDEVFLEGYKSEDDEIDLSPEDALDVLREAGYEVEVKDE